MNNVKLRWFKNCSNLDMSKIFRHQTCITAHDSFTFRKDNLLRLC